MTQPAMLPLVAVNLPSLLTEKTVPRVIDPFVNDNPLDVN